MRNRELWKGTMDRWIDEQMDKWTDGQLGRWIDLPCEIGGR